MLVFLPPPRFRFSPAILKAAQTPIERLIDRLSPKLAAALRKATETAQGRIDMEALAAAIEGGRISRAILELDLDRYTTDDLSDALKVLGEATIAGATFGAQSVAAGYALDVTNPKALEAAEERAAELLTAVNEETRQTVRALIARAYREQITAPDTARLIRDVVGLNDQQASALFNFRTGLVEDGLAPEKVAAQAAKYADRLLRQRADTIAQTEIHRASAEGQHELWRDAVREGRLNHTKTRRIWITNVGACEWCLGVEEINAEGVPIDGSFETPDGDLIDGPEESHVRCRCSSGLEFD